MASSLLGVMACGKPIIASRIGGILSVIDDGINGLLIPPGDVTKLIEKTIFCSIIKILPPRQTGVNQKNLVNSSGIFHFCIKKLLSKKNR